MLLLYERSLTYSYVFIARNLRKASVYLFNSHVITKKWFEDDFMAQKWPMSIGYIQLFKDSLLTFT